MPAILCLAVPVGAAEPLKLGRIGLSFGPGRGSAVVGWKMTALNRSAKVGVQLFLERRDAAGRTQWDSVDPETESGPVVLALEHGRESSGTFTIPLEKGSYGGFRMMLFHSPDGRTVDRGQMVWDSAANPATASIRLGFSSSSERRMLFPMLEVEPAPTVETIGGGYRITIAGVARVPADQATTGIWAVVQTETGVKRAALSAAEAFADPGSDVKSIPVRWVYETTQPGIWSAQVGLAREGGVTRWNPDRVEFEVGGTNWLGPLDTSKLPPRVRVNRGRFETVEGAFFDLYGDMAGARAGVGFARGGNFGNAICWTATPALNSPGYFRRLRELGVRFVRVNYSADRYLEQDFYPRAVERVVRNIWSAGLYPLLAPQDLPKGATDAEKVAKLARLLEQVATRYSGLPVWLEVLNEPYAFPTWRDWKPVASRLARTIRAVDPEAFVVVPFESWAKDGRGAAADPIRDVRVDLYDGHAYLKPEEVAERFGAAVRAGLPVMLGEFGGGSAYLKQMVKAIQDMPGVVAVAPWAFTKPGQDMLPLVESASDSEITFTAAGKVIVEAYRVWDAGRRAY